MLDEIRSDQGNDHSGDQRLVRDALARDRAALSALETRYLPLLRRALARKRYPAAVIDDVERWLRHRLARPSVDGPALLEGYPGNESLASWLRRLADSAAHDMTRTRDDRLRARMALVLQADADPRFR